MNTLPDHRRAISGRTHSRSWVPGESAMITRFSRPRSNTWDVLGWLGAAALIAGALALVYTPGALECFGILAQR